MKNKKIIDIDIYEELLKSELKMTASETEMELNLYYKQSSILEKLSTVSKETLSKLYKNLLTFRNKCFKINTI